MDGSQIESLLALASAKAARAYQRLTMQLDFCTSGIKTEYETALFRAELSLAHCELISASEQLLTIQRLYREAR